MRTISFRTFLNIAITSFAVAHSSMASAITWKKQARTPIALYSTSGLVTTDFAARAQSDVQVRRLLKLLAAKKLDTGEFYERLKQLRDRRR